MTYLSRLRIALLAVALAVLNLAGVPVVLAQAPIGEYVIESVPPGAEYTVPPGAVESAPRPTIRNVILMIGDGMGPQQVGLLLSYARLAPNAHVPDRTTAIEQLLKQGGLALVQTNPHGAVVVDSASAATQLATGEMAGSEMIGANHLGETVPTVLEIAKQLGKSTGLVSDTRITHATPAAFAAHQQHRSMENEIAVDMLANRVDVLLSGGLRHWVPQGVSDQQSATYLSLVQMTGGAFDIGSSRNDNRNLLLEARADYQLVFDRHALASVTEGKVLGLFANSEMYDALTERTTTATGENMQPSLAEMSAKAIELLSPNPQGFFLMVEGGQIDWAGHNNDAGSLLLEMLRFDNAVRTVLDWARDRDDTLVLVTADHETGGFGFSYSGNPLPRPAMLAGDVFRNGMFEPNFNFGPVATLDKIYNQEKSFYRIFSEFDALDPADRTPERLQEIVNDAMPFEITLDDAVRILTRERNRQFVESHKYLGAPTVPRMPDLADFYVYGRTATTIAARQISARRSGCWRSCR